MIILNDYPFSFVNICFLYFQNMDLIYTIHGTGEGSGTPLQCSCLENPWMEEPGRLQSMGQTRLSDFTFTFHFHALEKEMETHSSVLAWRIPGTGEPGLRPSMGLHRVGHDWSNFAAAAAAAAAEAAGLHHFSYWNLNEVFWETK